MKPRRRFVCRLTAEDRRKGGLASAKKRRQAAMATLAGLTPVQIYRMAFSAGWHVGVRRERRRMGLAA